MLTFLLVFIIGVLAGGAAGVLFRALVIVAGQADRERDP